MNQSSTTQENEIYLQPRPYQRKKQTPKPDQTQPQTIQVHPQLIEKNPYADNPTLTQSYDETILQKQLTEEVEKVKQKLERAKHSTKQIKRKERKDLSIKIGNRVGRGISEEELKKSLNEHMKHVKGRMHNKN